MSKYRLIQVSSENGNQEDIVFLDTDDTTPAEDYCSPGQSVDFDKVIEADLPGGFPVGSILNRD